ncbi:hypothetical protein EHS25_003075 [Saitozyma podzolica]|uniref:Uncharacterized protein n=1 Tax=Saitozyma podzolica TaxID=1890683 RepID=A0A427YD09_9TREE|nr:hypothetical protein EHS25_003075 [Saitozyma podzolica]
MFWKKPSPPSPSMASPTQRTSPSIAPRPILKTQPDCGGGPSIRFAGQRVASDDVVFPVRSPAPPPIRVHPPPHHGPHASGAGSSGSPVVQAPISPQYASFPSVSGSTAVTPARTGPRRSSRRPTSPSVTSFGARVQLPPQETPTPPMASSSHIQTPPTAYMSRAPPPPSPYRATTASDRRPITPLEPLPVAESSQSQLAQLTDRPPRSSSLFDSPNPPRLPPMAGVEVPMLNIIPATPDLGEEFTDEPVRPTETVLEEAADLGEDEDVIEPIFSPSAPSPPAQLVSLPTMQAIDLFLEGTFDPLPSDSHSTPHEVEAPLPPAESPPSPPFQSYPSLPSLLSHASMPSYGSEDSMKTSSSVSSLMSFPDVEEALGSMLASLSDPSFPVDTPNVESTPKVGPSNPGLGLGLDLPEPASITPRSPCRLVVDLRGSTCPCPEQDLPVPRPKRLLHLV